MKCKPPFEVANIIPICKASQIVRGDRKIPGAPIEGGDLIDNFKKREEEETDKVVEGSTLRKDYWRDL